MGAEAIQPAVLLVPFPAQGHVTPMLHLARALVANGVAATVAVPDFIHRRIASASSRVGGTTHVDADEDRGVVLASIPSGILPPEDGAAADPPGFAAILHAMEHHMPAQLERMLLTTTTGCGGRVACLVVDVLAYRVVAAIPELIGKGIISDSGTPVLSNQAYNDGQELVIRGLRILPPQLELSTNELPWFVGDSATQKSRFAFWIQTLQRAWGFRSVLINSFPGEDSTCIGWLDAQPTASVVYVSFGSWVGPIGHEKIRELALGLEATGRPFLWVLKNDPLWRAGLPRRYVERVASRSKLVEWAPQEDVLRHGAIGCYLTHCGWNLHRLKLGSVSQDDVRDCIERVMDGAEGTRLSEKMKELRERVVTAEARVLGAGERQVFRE
ncbi:hypothetical protein GUJ93_ZPchr0004g40317 [Zizania palustris]|uniref:Glycosyltransferase N-terminal domain-containing protein n=1 Tax=Zizania palustris TaxID=103762 RepID=A0A8J5SQT9_ZIZPA|nr:hypothetical protein GUJ93_ZPchr0004g40317 [Zizania palustris]